MGDNDGSKTRVRPVFNELLDRSPSGDGWLADLCALAMRTRAGGAFVPSAVGRLILPTADTHEARSGSVFERTVAPPRAFLEWLLRHPAQMQVTDRTHLGASSADAQKWRRKLFAADTRNRDQAIAEGVTQLDDLGVEGSGQEWWAFEGFTLIDCCLVTEAAVVFVEGKCAETVSPATRWFQGRSQLWRNVEVAQQLARGKAFGVILAVEGDGNAACMKLMPPLDDAYTAHRGNPLLLIVIACRADRYRGILPETTADIYMS